MRKLIALLSLLSMMLVTINISLGCKEVKASNGFDIEYIGSIYDPVEPYSLLNVKGKLNIRSGYNHSRLRIFYELYSPLKFGMSKRYASGYASSQFAYPDSREIAYSFDIDDSRLNLAREGITVRLGLYDLNTKSYIDYIDGHLYTKLNSEISIDDVPREYVLDRSLYLASGDISERYNFSNYTHLLDIPYYYRLDISSLSFVYKSYKAFTYKDAYLFFNDSNNLFPYIESNNSNKIIPLKAKDNNGTISFGCSSLYVEKDTLTMSSKARTGYIESNYFYLPKNKISKLQGLSLNINVNEMGINKISYTYSFEINFDSLLLGPCNESMYCIVGGVES